MAKPLNTHILISMIGLTLLAFAVMYGGITLFYFVIYPALYPDAVYEEKWQLVDFVVLGLILATGIVAASFVGWRLARNIAAPLHSVATAARAIAAGDFSTRAENVRWSFGEASDLLADFNSMAERLEKTEAELKYANSAIAHELRTPLTILRGRLQGLLDGAFQPTPELYTRLIDHVDDLSSIVEELRTLAMANAGQLDLTLEEADLPTEVEAVLTVVGADLSAAGINTRSDLKPARTIADRAKLRQALHALLQNCIRYAPGSMVTIETGMRQDTAFIRVSDDGPGLSNEGRARAFERFWRADGSRTRARGGSGLGLPIVHSIARAHGGEAVLVDRTGPGLTVEIRLPVVAF
ncbi:ATP-binding protein [Allorhizobium sp. BGMRC 0089]|uniref:ATP-binding protein n=1 Tax=Allorhizobium sonneratiae TaxID=2934936 RepID=UPI002033E6B7|nr:ATP-binding protein [Allorhizobium sonneratiae]MCM2292503.1 ATP-binding protein [Allorhizobium sonneratiae]